MAHPQYRANGWDPPVTNTQVFAFSGYIVSTALYIGMVASSGMAATGAAIGVVAALSVVVIAMYLAVSTIDPAVEPRSSLARSLDALATAAYCFRKRYDRAPWQSWCAKCRKVVPGLDHHCPWLNTDIGRRNYAQVRASLSGRFPPAAAAPRDRVANPTPEQHHRRLTRGFAPPLPLPPLSPAADRDDNHRRSSSRSTSPRPRSSASRSASASRSR